MLTSLVRQIVVTLKDERGIETLEWILIGALITGVGLFVYPGALQGQLVAAVNAVGAAVAGAA